MITLNDEVNDAMEAAAEAWPETGGRQASVLRRLLVEGGAVARRVREERAEARRAVLAEFADRFPAKYPPGYLDGLREEWPA
jgi:hypothetical protein